MKQRRPPIQSRRPAGIIRPLSSVQQENAALLKTALAMHQQGELDQAEVIYEEILRAQPQHFDALQLLAMIAAQRKNSVIALELFDQALKINPRHASLLNNRGNALRDLKRYAEALENYERALKIKPDHVEAHCNRGSLLQEFRRYEEALQSYARALKIKPDYAEAHWDESLCRLRLGEFALGWQKYEWRRKTPLGKKALRDFTQPLWLGKEDLNHKTILLHAEQGLGDTIQFCRYAAQLSKLGATVLLDVPPSLKTLLRSVEGVAMIVTPGEPLPDFDYHCPLLSLPLALQVDLGTITGSSYLHSDRQKLEAWKSRLTLRDKKKVGLVWGGSTVHLNDHNRSIALEAVQSLVDDHADFYCLQKELTPADRAALEHIQNIEFVGDDLHDFSDTAALVDLMDLVITVDTSVAHLAGALGKEVWILLPFNPDWRWLLDRDDSPWYHSAKLFRQPGIGDWSSVLTQVKAELMKKLMATCNAPGNAQ